MSGTVSPTAPTIDATGIHAPTFSAVQSYVTAAYQAIYGADIVTTPDSQDGQLIGILSRMVADTNAAAIAAYNSFSPSTAQGVGLSSVVKINGMARSIASNSSVDLVLVGQAGTTISNGAAEDATGVRWNLPAGVTIPTSGTITVTALAAVAGAAIALPNTITKISTPTYGWQTVNNPAAATPGAPVETDAALRARQSLSTALPSLSVLDGILGAVVSLPGVTKYKAYENDTNATDANGLPAHSISLVVQGGDATAICQTILTKKTPGCFTKGATRQTVADFWGINHDIGFDRPTSVAIGVHITIKALAGYTSQIGAAIVQGVAAYINNLPIGDDVIWSKLYLPANLCDVTSGLPTNATGTYDITAMTVASIPPGTYGTVNIVIAANAMATCDPATGVVLTVT